MKNKILERIIKKSETPDLLEILVDRLSLPDLQSLLLEVYRRRIGKLSPSDLLKNYITNRFVQISPINPKTFHEFNRLVYSLLPAGFETLELSPVSPLGNNSILAPVDQNNVLTTIRNCEVISDITSLLTLECTLRRKEELHKDARSKKRIKLCATQRVLRTQSFDEPAAFPHFRLIGLCTSGSDEGHQQFEIENLYEHIDFYLSLTESAKDVAYHVKEMRLLITFLDKQFQDKIVSTVFPLLQENHPQVKTEIDPGHRSGKGYYSMLRLQIHLRNEKGLEYLIVDGGFTDWTQQLLSNRKERMLTSGFGMERFISVFGKNKHK